MALNPWVSYLKQSMKESWLHLLYSCSRFVTESIKGKYCENWGSDRPPVQSPAESITRLPRAQEKAEQMFNVTISGSDSVSQQSISEKTDGTLQSPAITWE